MHAEIIDYIRRNRVSTTEIADCLNKSGVVPQVSALNRGHFCVGPVSWVYAWNETNWTIHEQIQALPEGRVVVATGIACGDRALIGDLVAKYLLLYRQAKAIVVEGAVRDAPRLIKENWPIWSKGTTPIGCFNHQPDALPNAELLAIGRRYEQAIAVCDDCGVVIIEKEFQVPDFLEKLEWIEEQEDTWYDCINRRKWSTFDTVCLKKYLPEGKDP
jgi:4-hydroxy-4-methyl-2-oxoglutarate aldolase